MTRDRNYGEARWRKRNFSIVDTGGFEPKLRKGSRRRCVVKRCLRWMKPDVVLFVTDARDGLMTADREVASDPTHRRLSRALCGE